MVCPICGTRIIYVLDTGSRCLNFIVTFLPIKNYHHFSLHSQRASVIYQNLTEYNHFTNNHKYDVQTIERIH